MRAQSELGRPISRRMRSWAMCTPQPCKVAICVEQGRTHVRPLRRAYTCVLRCAERTGDLLRTTCSSSESDCANTRRVHVFIEHECHFPALLRTHRFVSIYFTPLLPTPAVVGSRGKAPTDDPNSHPHRPSQIVNRKRPRFVIAHRRS